MLCLLLEYIILAIAYMDASTYHLSLDLTVLYRRTKASYVESFGLNSSSWKAEFSSAVAAAANLTACLTYERIHMKCLGQLYEYLIAVN